MNEPPPLPWLDWQVGERVVVRYRDSSGQRTDALGYLTEVARDHVCVNTKRGVVRVDASRMIVGRRVPPPRYLGGVDGFSGDPQITRGHAW